MVPLPKLYSFTSALKASLNNKCCIKELKYIKDNGRWCSMIGRSIVKGKWGSNIINLKHMLKIFQEHQIHLGKIYM